MEIILEMLEKNDLIKTMRFPWKGKIDIAHKKKMIYDKATL